MNKITISNPNQWTKPETGTEMVTYQVSGDKASVEMYKQEQLAELAKEGKVPTYADNGAPLKHYTLDASFKYGAEAELISGTSKEGNPIWFLENTTALRLREKALAGDGLPQAVKAIMLAREEARVENFIIVLASNKTKSLNAFIAKNKDTFSKVVK